MKNKIVASEPRNVRKTVTVTVAGKGIVRKNIAVHRMTEDNIRKIMCRRKVAFDALARY